LSKDKPNLDHLFVAAGAFITGAWWVKNQTEEAKKSRAEREDPDGVEEVCVEIAPILDDWEPEEYDSEDGFVEDLFEYLDREAPEDWDIEMCPDTREGRPDILINDRLALEVKINPKKGERDRLVGQTAGYSREWVTWIVLVDTPRSRIGMLEDLLRDKGLERILIFDYS
jgi:hypothetical protein